MSGNWSLSFDSRDVTKRMQGIMRGLEDRTKLHERLVIRLQQWIYRNWPKEPGLSSFTRLSRTGGAPLLDKGTLRITLTGANPGAVQQGSGSLNAATKDSGVVGSTLPYAALHNFGGTITPKQAKALALPATREARQAGSPRNFSRKLFFVPARSGNAIGWLAERIKKARKGEKAGEIRRHYLLKASVTIPARRFMPTEQQFAPEGLKVTEQYLREISMDGGS